MERHNRVIEFNTDDMNPQNIPFFLERVIEAGASDAFVIPVIMKKGRPGYLFKVTCSEEAEKKILEVIFCDTTTIGVRRIITEGIILKRKIYLADTTFGKIQVKEITLPNTGQKIVPEFEDIKRIAERENLPLEEIRGLLLNELNNKTVQNHL